MLRPSSGQAADADGRPITQVQERIAHLVQSLEKARTRIIIPTPALSEVLVRSGTAGPQIVETLGRSAVFRIVSFDALAAIEAAIMTRAAIDAGNKRGGSAGSWAKVKFDRQIVAIAKVARATTIYSDDADIRSLAAAEGISVIGLAELPLPPQDPQIEMQLKPPTQDERSDGPSAGDAGGGSAEGDEGTDEPGSSGSPMQPG